MVRQFLVLTRRYLDLVLRDKLLLSVLMAVMPIIGALVLLVSDANWLVGNTLAEISDQLNADLAGAVSSATYAVVGDSQTLLFIMALASVLLGLFGSVYEIVKEWSVYQRERMVSLRILPYIASYVVMALILQISAGILAEAGLSILGLGPKTTEVPTLGLMMNWAMIYQAQILGKWWAYQPVVVTIALIAFSMNLMNTGLDQVFNPALRED